MEQENNNIDNQNINIQEQNTKQNNNQNNSFTFDYDKLANTSPFEQDKENPMKHHLISIAPMLDVTNPHWRFLYRLVSRQSTLYTEMIHANTIIHAQKQKCKYRQGFQPIEHPIVFQLGGSDPDLLAQAAKIVEDMGYDEINLNCGCPSQKVQCGSFGACLMKEPELVGECMKKIGDAIKIPFTVKHRIGVDDREDYDFTKDFITQVHEMSGVTHFQAHARKAYLKGLNPEQNRNIPPLNYDYVVKLAHDFPDFQFSINGGFKSYKMVHDILKPENKLLGCMIGRWAQENVWNLNDVDRQFYQKPNPGYSRREILQIYAEYGHRYIEQNPDQSFTKLVNPINPLFAGERHNNQWRRFLGSGNTKKQYGNFKEFINKAIENFEQYNKTALDERPPINDEEAKLALEKYEAVKKQQEKSKPTNNQVKIKASKFQKKMEAKVEKKKKLKQEQQNQIIQEEQNGDQNNQQENKIQEAIQDKNNIILENNNNKQQELAQHE